MSRFEPALLREWLQRALGSLHLGRGDADLEDELRAHEALAAEDARRQGVTPDEARRIARLRVGGLLPALDATREQRGVPWFDDLTRDLRHGVRTLGRSPAFTTVAVLTLALGIGANTAIFQLVDAIRLRSLPVADPQQIAIVELADLTRWSGRRTTGYPVLTHPLWEQLRDHQRTFAGVLAWSNVALRLDRDAGFRSARGLFVSGAFFDVLGVEPLIGRVFTAADDRAGCGVPGAVVSHGFWQRQLGGAPSAVGRPVVLNGRPVEVIGVTPPGFTGVEVGRAFDVAVPLCAHDELGAERGWLTSGSTWWLTVMGRLPEGRSLESANAELAVDSARLFEVVPAGYPPELVDDYRSLRLRAVPGSEGVSALRRQYGAPLLTLLAISGLVLLICCTNLGNLILARASAREREFAVRLALGASWSRLVRQLMVENVLLATAGAVAGAASGAALGRVLTGYLIAPGTEVVRGAGAEPSLALAFDARVFGFVALLAAVAALTFGLIPAWRASRVAAHEAMKAGSRTLTAGREGSGLRRALVIAQVALSLVLLFGALLFGGTLRNLLAVEAGFEPDPVTIARVDFSRMPRQIEGRSAVTREVLERIRQVPGVSATAEVRHVPLGGTGSSLTVWRDGADPAGRTTVRLNAVSDGYLGAMGMPLLAGRDIAIRDANAAPKVAIVNQAFTRRLGLPADPVGQRFRAEGPSDDAYEIIGVVPDSKYFSLREDFLPIAFVPLAQISDPRPFTDLVIRSAVPLPAVASAVRAAVAGVSPVIAVDLRTFDSSIRDGLARERFMATLSGVFGTLAALIAAVGLYGVMSYRVLRRTNEIGVRIALGAGRGAIVRMVLREAGALLAIGLAIGSALALMAASLVQSLLFGVPPHDLRPVALAGVVLATAACAAAYLPARRAATLDPVTALRDN